MLDGTAEWSDVPEVIRSSFYVLHKSWRGYDKRLSRCEKSLAACLDRQARIELEQVQQSRRDALCMPSARGTSSENELTELQQKMSALKDELAYKLDKVGFLTTMDGAMRVTHDEHTKHITEKLQAHSSRVETTLLKMKTVLSRKLVAVEEHSREAQASAAQHIQDQCRSLQDLQQHVSILDISRDNLQAADKSKMDRLSDIESCIMTLYRGFLGPGPDSAAASHSVKTLASTVPATLLQDTLLQRNREILDSSVKQLTQTTAKMFQELREQLCAVQMNLREVESTVSTSSSVPTALPVSNALVKSSEPPKQQTHGNPVEVQFELLQEQAVKLSVQLKELQTIARSNNSHSPAMPTPSPTRTVLSGSSSCGCESQVHVNEKVLADHVNHNQDYATTPPAVPSMLDTKKLDLRHKRELSKARFDEVALRQKERLRGRQPPPGRKLD
ncbi:hypothetical protein AaE_005023 [Aphanomyces astaci]|uniref:Uncharacterized protein n=1 Tax=Aphanomyces astaci TaxID=112090 RepID=A0A6A5ANJ3_APHAT|nr:hypothetical protein AaE_005023 [Aphanomyces astaci]